jgi:hypothetical protein
MRKFLKESASLGVLMLGTVAVLGYFALIRSTATAALPSAGTLASHRAADCPTCRLPLYGQWGSKLGPGPNTALEVAKPRTRERQKNDLPICLPP